MTYASPSSINASKGFMEILYYVNNITDLWISNLILVAIYVIVLMGFYKSTEDFKGAMAVSGYGTFVIALLLWASGFVSGVAFGIAIASAILGTIILLLDNS